MISKLVAYGVGLGLLVPGVVSAEDNSKPVFREEGRASVYSDWFEGRTTANGERFDQSEPTAAHPELPLGIEVTVISLDTGRKAKLRVNDRGPYAKGRDLDLSEAAARKLGVTREIDKEGDAEVRIEVTERQVEEAINGPEDVAKVERHLAQARAKATKEGTRQPMPPPALEPPRE
jgi:rare lipoprotein A